MAQVSKYTVIIAREGQTGVGTVEAEDEEAAKAKAVETGFEGFEWEGEFLGEYVAPEVVSVELEVGIPPTTLAP